MYKKELGLVFDDNTRITFEFTDNQHIIKFLNGIKILKNIVVNSNGEKSMIAFEEWKEKYVIQLQRLDVFYYVGCGLVNAHNHPLGKDCSYYCEHDESTTKILRKLETKLFAGMAVLGIIGVVLLLDAYSFRFKRKTFFWN